MDTVSYAVVPRGAFVSTYDVHREGVPVGTLTCSPWRDRGRIVVDGVSHTVLRKGWRGPFLLLQEKKEVANAIKPSAFRREFIADVGTLSHVLRPRRWTGPAFHVERDGVVCGTIERRGLLKRGARAALPSDLPSAAALFLVWLVLIQWRAAQQGS